MEDIQEFMKKIRELIRNGKPGEEIFPILSSLLKEQPEAAERIIGDLADVPHETTTQILQRMVEEIHDKKTRKTIRRVLYRLKSKGVPLGEVHPDRGHSILRPSQAEPPQGYATAIDPIGQRLLVLVVAHAGRGYTLLHGVLGDTEGLVNFLGAEMSRKEVRAFLDHLSKESPFPMVEMEASYIAFLFSQTYQRILERKKTPPQDYLHFKGEIERLKKHYEQPLIYAFLSLSEVTEDDRWLKKGEDLLKEEPFVTWNIEEGLLQPYADTLVEAQGSKLFLNQGQKEARFQEVYLKALSEIFPEERRTLYGRRLEETAYILYRLGKEERAKIALATAADLRKPPNPFQPNPFLFQLVMRSIQALLAEAQEKREKEPSLIIKP
jgi:hypothetical protein